MLDDEPKSDVDTNFLMLNAAAPTLEFSRFSLSASFGLDVGFRLNLTRLVLCARNKARRGSASSSSEERDV